MLKRKPKPFQERQGDILIERIDALPAGLKKAKRDKHDRIVLAEGEFSGHAHGVRGDAQGFLKESAERDALSPMVDFILVGGGGAQALHEKDAAGKAEHDALTLPPGAYKVTQQREADEEDADLRAFD